MGGGGGGRGGTFSGDPLRRFYSLFGYKRGLTLFWETSGKGSGLYTPDASYIRALLLNNFSTSNNEETTNCVHVCMSVCMYVSIYLNPKP